MIRNVTAITLFFWNIIVYYGLMQANKGAMVVFFQTKAIGRSFLIGVASIN